MRLNGILGAVVLTAATAGAQAPSPDWVQTSNEHAQVLLRVMAETSPETAARYGVEGVDDQILDLSIGYRERRRKALVEAQRELKARLERAQDPKVRQDLEIMVAAVELDLAGQEVSERLELPYYDLNRLVFHSLRGLLDERVAAERRPAALERLKRYAGLAAGYEPIALLATQRTREKLDQAGLQAPYRGQLDKSLTEGPQMRAGLAPLFEEFEIEGYESALEVLEDQLAVYDDFVAKELLPRAREDFRQPPPIYAHSLRELGIDIEPEELAGQARACLLYTSDAADDRPRV